MATRQLNLAGILGSDQWGEKDRPKECSSTADTGFNGGELRSHAWVLRYVAYLGSFYCKADLVKFKVGY